MAINLLNIFLFSHVLIYNYASVLLQLSLWVFPSIIENSEVYVNGPNPTFEMHDLFLYHLEMKNLLYAQNKFITRAMRKIASRFRA